MALVPRGSAYTGDAPLSVGARLPEPVTVGDEPQPDNFVEVNGFRLDLGGPLGVLGAAVRQSNTVGSWLADQTVQTGDKFRVEPGFSTWDAIKGTKYEEHWGSFVDLFNRPAVDAMKRQIDMETEDRRTLAAAGVWGDLASFASAAVDIPSLLPAGAIVRGARTGATVFRSALSVGTAATAAAAASEASLQGSQQLRTPAESAFAIGGSAVLGALLGAGAGAVLSRSARGAAEVRFDAEIRDRTAPDIQVQNEAAVLREMRPEGAGVGAERVAAPDSLADLTVAGSAAERVAQASGWARLNPLVRLYTSPSAAVRRVAEGLLENPLYLRKNLAGRASEAGVETLVKEYSQGAVTQAMQEMDDFYRALRRGGATLRRDEFRQLVGQAMRRADESPIPEVAQAAKAWRQRVFEPLKERAIEEGLLPKDVEVSTAESYFSRLWNWRKIEAQKGRFQDIVRNWIGDQVQRQTERLTLARDARLRAVDAEIADLRLPAEERSRLLTELPAQLKALVRDNPQFAALDRTLGDLRSRAGAARQAGRNAEAAGHLADVRQRVQAAGKDYADYVTARNALSSRLRRVRNNLIGRQDQVEALRTRMADEEAANVDRLWRMHRSIADLEARFEREGPDAVSAELSQARTDFAKVLERSNRLVDSMAEARSRLTAEMQAAAEAGDTVRANELAEQLGRGDPFVQEARLNEQMDQLAERIGQLEEIDPEDAITALRAAIEKRIDQAAARVEDAGRRMAALAERLRKADPKRVESRIAYLQRRRTAIEGRYADRFISDADRADYVNEIVDEIYNRITGRIDGDLPRDIVPTTRGPLKERTFNIPDRLVEDFIESDVELVGRRYARIMAAEVEMTRKFGSADMQEAIRGIIGDYSERQAAIIADQSLAAPDREKALQRLAARERADLRDIRAVRDMLRGTYMARENATGFARALAVANTFNYLRTMGGVVMSSLMDVARPVMVHGLQRYMGDGVAPLLRNLRAVKLSVKEARLAGAVAERILNTRMATWAEVADPYAVSSPFERFLENTAKNFSIANGMVYWNDMMKSFASVMTQNRILGNALAGGNLKATERAYMAFLGIDDTMAARIARQFEQFGTTDGGVRIANTEDWADVVARRAYRAAVNKDVDSIIVTKGIGDVPLFAKTPIGRAVIQFKSFALASHQRAFMRGLQGLQLGVDGGAAGVLAGTMASVVMGMMVYWLKALESNRLEQVSDNPGQWLAEGLDRSGLFAVAFEINNTMEKALNIGAYRALQAVFPGQSQSGKASRYMVRSTAAAFTGPTGDLVDTLVRVVRGLQDGQISQSDVTAIKRIAPFATLPGLRSVVEWGIMPPIKEAVGD